MPLVLLIEDDISILEETTIWLEFESFEVLQTTDGASGLELAQKHHPDIIVCDINLPGKNGFEILQALRKNSGTVITPFIFLTARTTKQDMRQGMQLGADDYLTKPFTRAELLGTIRTQLEKHNTTQIEHIKAFSQHILQGSDKKLQQTATSLYHDVRQHLIDLQTLLLLNDHFYHQPDANIIRDIQQILKKTITSLDLTIIDLYPTVLDYLGFLPALRWQLERLSAQTGLNIEFESHDIEPHLEGEVAFVAYQIIRDSLENTATHAQTNQASVEVRCKDDYLEGVILDNGIGFDLQEKLLTGHVLGIMRIYERARSVNGSVTIDTSKYNGCRISFRIPQRKTQQHPELSDLPTTLLPRSTQRKQAKLNPVITTEQSAESIKIFLIESNDLVRKGLISLLAEAGNIELVGDIRTEENITAMVHIRQPDVIIFDLAIPGLDALDVLRQLKASVPDARILTLSSHSENVYAWEAMKSGADGCILKESCANELISAIYSVHNNNNYISPDFIIPHNQMMDRSSSDSNIFQVLTKREQEILELIAQDITNREIAEELVISIRTVETHRANLMRKLGLNSKTDLILLALSEGIISIEDEQTQ